MFIYNIFLQYTAALGAGVLCLIFIILQGRDKLKAKKAYRAMVLFVANIMLISLILYISFSTEVLFQEYEANFIFRTADYFVYGILLYTWMRVLETVGDSEYDKGTKILLLAGKIIGLIGTALFVMVAAVFMNDQYYIEITFMQGFYRYLEICYAIVGTLLIITCAFRILPKLVLSLTRKYTITTSAIISLYFLIQIIMTSGLGVEEISDWGENAMDVGGWLLSLINAFTCYFVYKRDFQKLYSVPENRVKAEDSIAAAFDSVAVTHKLTQREREIIELVYKGKTNPVIADELCISLSTVKTHLRNIFEKLGVTSRMELAYLVNNEKDNQQIIEKNSR